MTSVIHIQNVNIILFFKKLVLLKNNKLYIQMKTTVNKLNKQKLCSSLQQSLQYHKNTKIHQFTIKQQITPSNIIKLQSLLSAQKQQKNTMQDSSYSKYDLPQAETQDIAIQTQKPHRQAQQQTQKPQISSPKINNLQDQNQQPKLSENQEEEYDKVDINSIIPKLSNKQKLIQQNIKLKAQIYQLAQQIDEITKKPSKTSKQQTVDPGLKTKKLQLKKHQIHLMEIRNKIFNIRHQIESYDILHINDLQNKIKMIRLEIKQKQQEKQGLLMITKQQTLASRMPEEIEQKCLSNRQLIKELREKYSIIHNKLVQNERTIRKSHQQIVVKQIKIKDMDSKILARDKQKQKESKKRSKSIYNKISEDQIDMLKNEIQDLQKQRKESDKIWQNKIKIVEGQIHSKKQEQQKKILIHKQKQKQLRLLQIKLKEINRLLKPVQVKKEVSDLSMFRTKRNIKYLSK